MWWVLLAVRQKILQPITPKEADTILNRLNTNENKPRPKTLFEPGEEVLVIDGPFTEFRGLVEKSGLRKSRLQLTAVNVVNRPTLVELEFKQEKNLTNLLSKAILPGFLMGFWA